MFIGLRCCDQHPGHVCLVLLWDPLCKRMKRNCLNLQMSSRLFRMHSTDGEFLSLKQTSYISILHSQHINKIGAVYIKSPACTCLCMCVLPCMTAQGHSDNTRVHRAIRGQTPWLWSQLHQYCDTLLHITVAYLNVQNRRLHCWRVFT